MYHHEFTIKVNLEFPILHFAFLFQAAGGTIIQTDEKMSRMSLMYSDTASFDNPFIYIHAWMTNDIQREWRNDDNKPVNRVDIPWRITSGVYMGKAIQLGDVTLE